jgi:DNA-binding LacI/PurR family transcriptional regulator
LRLSTLVTAGGHGGEILDRVRRHGLAGILAVEPIPAAVQERLMAERVPVVGVVAWMPPVAPTTAHVGFAFIQTVATALRHFIELGHERIAILRSGVPDVRPDDSAVLPARYSFGRACRETCEAHGVRYHPEYMVSAGSIDFVNGQRRVDAEAGMRGMATLLAMDPRPSAVYITDDFLAFGALRELARQGVKVPQDISVISFANAGVAAMFPFPVTTTEFDGRNAGARAVQVLRDLIAQEPSVRREFELPAEFVDRGSCRRIQV